MLLVVFYEVSVCERPSERVCFLTEPLLAFLATQIILCKTILDLIWFWLTLVRFWPNGSRPEASQCAMITQPASDPILIKCKSDQAISTLRAPPLIYTPFPTVNTQ